LERAEGDFAAAMVGDRDRRGPAEVEMIAIMRCRPQRSASGRRVCSSPARSCRHRQQFGQPRQVVGRSREGEVPTDAIASSELGLLLPADRLHPAEGFLDPFADALADGISGVSRGAAVDRPLVFSATWGVAFIERSSLTKSSAS
jgi:hypothetical protein